MTDQHETGESSRSGNSHYRRFQGRLPSIAESVGDFGSVSRRSSSSASWILPAPPPPPPRLIVPGLTEYRVDGLLLVGYTICGKIYSMQQPPNEGMATFTRQTIGGRTLSYRLKVVQQPEKARACGSGPRSSADRRPVDPPPVVKLTVYEGHQDITLRYDAGFMLYASLDIARPIANGRMHNSQIVPVLTGVAVAGVAYLERPKQAGYFIFPDLSVRHEGWYRLRFHLFEQVKHAEDADLDRPFESAQPSTDECPMEPRQHEAMANRMFVNSTPFQVFSAKKFPGLNTSTELSKVVAEQGCRVRIRREIRQRRKVQGKDDEEEHRSSQATPEPKARSMHHRSLSRDNELVRRMSIDPTQSQILSRKASAEQIPAVTPAISASINRMQAPVSSPLSASYHQSEPRRYRSDAESQVYVTAPPHPLTGLPRTMAPAPSADLSKVQLPPLSSQLPPFASLMSENKVTSPRPRQYQLPEPASQKRSYSPQAYGQQSALKDGARPDMLPTPSAVAPLSQPHSSLNRQRSSNTLQWVMNPAKPHMASFDSAIEADNDPYGDDSDSECSLLEGPFVYRRADGTKSGKPLIAPMYKIHAHHNQQ